MKGAKPRSIRRAVNTRAGKIAEKDRSACRAKLDKNKGRLWASFCAEGRLGAAGIKGRRIVWHVRVESSVVSQQNRAAIERSSSRAFALASPEMKCHFKLQGNDIAGLPVSGQIKISAWVYLACGLVIDLDPGVVRPVGNSQLQGESAGSVGIDLDPDSARSGVIGIDRQTHGSFQWPVVPRAGPARTS